MMEKLRFPQGKKLWEFLRRSKYVLIIAAAGLALLLLPAEKRDAAPDSAAADEEEFSVEALETRLGEILSRVEGAGEVSVMLTLRSGTQRVLAVDRDLTQDGGERRQQEETVILDTGDGEQAVLIGRNYPVFQGALAVCSGGDDPEVCLKLTRALSALTGLSSGRITVCKGS